MLKSHLATQMCGVFVLSAVGKWSPGVTDVDADLVPPLELCIRTR